MIQKLEMFICYPSSNLNIIATMFRNINGTEMKNVNFSLSFVIINSNKIRCFTFSNGSD